MDHILSDLSNMTCPSWVALQAWLGFIELDKAVVRNGGGKMILLVQGKRNPSKMVGTERGHQRADTVKPQSQKTN